MKEYKIIRVPRENDFSKLETYIQEMNKAGWQLVSVSTDVRYPMDVIVALQKEIE